MKQINEAFTQEESSKIYDNFLAIVNDKKRRDRLVSKHGKNAEAVAYGTAVNQVKKQAANPTEEPTIEEPMENNKLKEMVKAALTKPLDEKKKSSSFTSQYDDKFTDGRKKLPDGLQKSILNKQGNLDEDLDLGHEDNEPHMLKADLYRIGKYAMELYKMVDQFEGNQEVDFPHWWQAKIIEAKNMLISAKHYLDFEIKEPQLDAMVGVASEEGAIDESLTKSANILARSSKDVDEFKKKWYEKYKSKQDDDTDDFLKKVFNSVNKSSGIIEEMTPEKSRKKGMPFKDKIKEIVLAKLKDKK